MKTLLTLLFLIASVSISAADNDLHAHMVLFHEADRDMSADQVKRLSSLGVYVESFLNREMHRWKKPIERPKIFARDAKGEIRVTVVSGKLAATGRNALPEIRTRALREAGKKLGIPLGGNAVWWIFYDYPGVRGFQGGGRGAGGVAINAYPVGEGAFDPAADMASSKLADAKVKGTIHEFGHALGLPHIGPRPGHKLGNSLMGPVNRAYWRKTDSEETRVYLTEVSAAMLWNHPIFQATKSGVAKPSMIEVTDLKLYEEDGLIVVQGKLVSGQKAHTAVVLDSERGRFGDYWARSYAAEIALKTGEFKIVVGEPFDSGTLHLAFCLGNGLTTDGGKPFQRGTNLRFEYQGEPGSRTIEKIE